jgi:hypothetical protein
MFVPPIVDPNDSQYCVAPDTLVQVNVWVVDANLEPFTGLIITAFWLTPTVKL